MLIKPNWNAIGVFDPNTGASLAGAVYLSPFNELYGLEFVRTPTGGRLFSVGTQGATGAPDRRSYFIEYQLGGPGGLPVGVVSASEIQAAGVYPPTMMGLAYVPERDRFCSNAADNTLWEIDLKTGASYPLFGLALSATNGLAFQDGRLYGLSAVGDPAYTTLVYFDFEQTPHQIAVSDASQVASGWALSGSTTPTMSAPSVVLCGDSNCDGLVNNGDIEAFILSITNSRRYAAEYPGCPLVNGDANLDTLVNTGDTDPFISVITGGPGCGHN